MGYFSELAMIRWEYREDHSITDCLQQMKWRAEDLQERMLALEQAGKYSRAATLSKEELRYVLPEHLPTYMDTVKAFEILAADLLDRYGVNILPDREEPETGIDEVTPYQLSLYAVA